MDNEMLKTSIDGLKVKKKCLEHNFLRVTLFGSKADLIPVTEMQYLSVVIDPTTNHGLIILF